MSTGKPLGVHPFLTSETGIHQYNWGVNSPTKKIGVHSETMPNLCSQFMSFAKSVLL
jgi:hypothetical protein